MADTRAAKAADEEEMPGQAGHDKGKAGHDKEQAGYDDGNKLGSSGVKRVVFRDASISLRAERNTRAERSETKRNEAERNEAERNEAERNEEK